MLFCIGACIVVLKSTCLMSSDSIYCNSDSWLSQIFLFLFATSVILIVHRHLRDTFLVTGGIRRESEQTNQDEPMRHVHVIRGVIRERLRSFVLVGRLLFSFQEAEFQSDKLPEKPDSCKQKRQAIFDRYTRYDTSSLKKSREDAT